jgi:hypothetical protein
VTGLWIGEVAQCWNMDRTKSTSVTSVLDSSSEKYIVFLGNDTRRIITEELSRIF